MKRLVEALPDARGIDIANAYHNVLGDNARDLTEAIERLLAAAGYA
jgi:hypothetical protein